jgi:hypothetical protein
VVQLLEGARPCWSVYKRYSDFIQLHEALVPEFKKSIDDFQADLANSGRGSSLQLVVPILPPKIHKQSEQELSDRRGQLEDYLNSVFQLLYSKAQFNQAILDFLGFDKKAESEGQAFADLGSDFFDQECL